MGRERGVMECVETHGKGLEAEGSMGRVKRVSMALEPKELGGGKAGARPEPTEL